MENFWAPFSETTGHQPPVVSVESDAHAALRAYSAALGASNATLDAFNAALGIFNATPCVYTASFGIHSATLWM